MSGNIIDRGAAIPCALLHDVLEHFRNQNTPVYVASLDAEKCFDKIWHDGLLYKLIHILPSLHWIVIYKMYKTMHAIVRWNGCYSGAFAVTRGIKQGSVISPTFFNIFIDELLCDLKSTEGGVHLDNIHLNSFAYADDVTLLNATVPGLQQLIDKCVTYASM